MEYINLTISIICFVGSAILLAVTYKLRNDARQMLGEAYDINQDTIEREERLIPKCAVKNWKALIPIYTQDERYELCEIIQKAIEGKDDEEIIDTPKPFVLAYCEDGIHVFTL